MCVYIYTHIYIYIHTSFGSTNSPLGDFFRIGWEVLGGNLEAFWEAFGRHLKLFVGWEGYWQVCSWLNRWCHIWWRPLKGLYNPFKGFQSVYIGLLKKVYIGNVTAFKGFTTLQRIYTHAYAQVQRDITDYERGCMLLTQRLKTTK